MRFLLLISLSLTAFFSYSYTIREGGRTVGAGQVTDIIAFQVGLPASEVDAILDEIGKQIGKNLAYQNELQLGSLYFTNDHNGVDQDCDSDKCEVQINQGELVNNFSTMILDKDNTEIFNLFLNRTMNEIIQSTNNYALSSLNNDELDYKSKFSALPLLNDASYSAWMEISQYNPIEDAFKSAEACVKFREEFLELSSSKLKDGNFEEAKREKVRKLREKALIKSESATKRMVKRRIRIQALKDSKEFNLTPEIFQKVSNRTDIDYGTVTKIESLATDLIFSTLSKGENIQVTGLGYFEISSQVNIVEVVNVASKVEGELIEDIASDSIVSPISWTPSSTTQIKLTNENQKQASAKIENNGGKGFCQFGQCFCSPGFQLNADAQTGETTKENELSEKDLLLQTDEKGVDQCTEMVITQNYQTLSSILQLVETDLIDYKDSNDEQAATRVRKAMQDLKKLAQDIRVEVTDSKNK